jgi:hypothetical protein
VNKYERAGPIISQLKHHKKYKEFRELERTARANPATGGSKLVNYLIMPVQRCAACAPLFEG